MPREAQASLRMSKQLKDEIQKVATETRRTLSNAIELLLWRGVQAFRNDGILIDRPESSQAQLPSRAAQNTELSTVELMAEQILEAALKKAREGKSRGGGESPRKKSRSRVA